MLGHLLSTMKRIDIPQRLETVSWEQEEVLSRVIQSPRQGRTQRRRAP